MQVCIFTHKSPFSEIPEFVEEEVKYFPHNVKISLISLADTEEKTIVGLNGYNNITAFAISPKSIAVLIKISLRALNWIFFSELFYAVFRLPLQQIGSRVIQLLKIELTAQRYYIGFEKIKAQFNLADESIVFYSYWLGPATMAAIRLKGRYRFKLNCQIVSRAHGSDLYEYSNKCNWIPYLKKNLSNCDLVFPISLHGKNYIIERQLISAQKVKLSRLGIPNFNLDGHVPSRIGTFHLLSCSYIIPVKRINLIVEALSLITNHKLRWTHLGGGINEAELRTLCAQRLDQKPNIVYHIAGNVSNQEVIQFYRNNNVNLFINVSASEGIPVTMMEAACFSVPILSSNIGGISEIVLDGYNGRLLNRNFTLKDLIDSIEELISLDNEEYFKLCENSKVIFKSLYNAEVNYRNHFMSLLEECQSN